MIPCALAAANTAYVSQWIRRQTRNPMRRRRPDDAATMIIRSPASTPTATASRMRGAIPGTTSAIGEIRANAVERERGRVERQRAEPEHREQPVHVRDDARPKPARRGARAQDEPREDACGQQPVGGEAGRSSEYPQRRVAFHDVRVIVRGGRVTTRTDGADEYPEE